MLNTTRKNRLNFFFHLKVCLFSKICVFINLLGPKKCSYMFHSNCQNCFWTLSDHPRVFVTLDNARRKKGQNLLPREHSVLLNNLVLELLGPKEMIISLAHYLSEKHVCPYDLFHDICHIRYYEREYATFFSLKILHFFQKLVFPTAS